MLKQSVKVERPAKAAGRASRLISEGFGSGTDPAVVWKKERDPAGGVIRRGVGLDGTAVCGPSPQPSGLPNAAGRFHRGATRGELDSIISGRAELCGRT